MHPWLHELVDYAGLFPPAALGMAEAARRYAAYRDGPDQCLLGRFVVPAARLTEFERERPRPDKWRLSVLIGPDIDLDLAAVSDFRGADVVIDTVEIRADSPAAIRTVAGDLVAYYEVPISTDPQPFIEALAACGARAKMRTGGVTALMIPDVIDVARFIRTCKDLAVPFKATAGLHHAIRGVYPLTYEPGSASAKMHGFVNVLAAAALDEADLVAALEEESLEAFSLDAAGLAWRGHRTDRDPKFAFGSCSFEEPVADLRKAGWV